MTDLASPDDVALALGLADSSEFSAPQGLRVNGLLSRVSRVFRREAGREFTPGTTTVRLLTVGDRVHLPDPITSVDSATMLDRNNDPVALEYTVDGQELILEYGGTPLWSGISVTVTYTHDAAVPADVVATVAAIVARHLTVDPATDGKIAEMAAGPFRQVNAEWVSSTTLLTYEECEQARAYRYPGTAIIIQKP